ncbi:hypothetical protein HK096_002071, partial [Nowakowskiella sp. JEL0078]
MLKRLPADFTLQTKRIKTEYPHSSLFDPLSFDNRPNMKPPCSDSLHNTSAVHSTETIPLFSHISKSLCPVCLSMSLILTSNQLHCLECRLYLISDRQNPGAFSIELLKRSIESEANNH